MTVVRVRRPGVQAAPRAVPTDSTAAILPMTFDRVGQETGEGEAPVKVSSLSEAFKEFKPKLDFTTQVGDEGVEFVAELEFNSLKDFDPKQIRARTPGKRNDVADLQSQVDLLHRMREGFALLGVKRAWENETQRGEIVDALNEFKNQLARIAGKEGASE